MTATRKINLLPGNERHGRGLGFTNWPGGDAPLTRNIYGITSIHEGYAPGKAVIKFGVRNDQETVDATSEEMETWHDWVFGVPVQEATVHDSYGLTSNTGGDFYILGNTNGTESCLIALRFADRICLDTSDDNQFYVHVEIGPKVDRFKTTRTQWNNLIGTLKISMVRYNLDAEEPGTVGG